MDVDTIRRALAERATIGTHWDGCQTDPAHRDCAIHWLLAEVDKLKGFLKNECTDWAETHTAVAEMARPIVGDEFLDGHGYFVDVEEICAKLVAEIGLLRAKNAILYDMARRFQDGPTHREKTDA